MLKMSEVRINYLEMEKDFQLINSSKEFTYLKSILEENIPKKVVYGNSTHKKALKESEDFMKNTFRLHRILHVTNEEIEKMISDKDIVSDITFLEKYNRLGRAIDAYQLPLRIRNIDSWYGTIVSPILPFEESSLISKEKIMFNYIGLSNKATRLTGRIISHEVTHSQIDSNKGATRYYHNYEALPRFIELLHHTSSEDDTFFNNIVIMLQEHSLLEKINYFEKKFSSKNHLLENNEKDFEISMYFISSLKALNLYEIYLNLSAIKKQELINQIQKVFDGEMVVEELLDKNKVSIDKGIESAKRLVKQTKRELQ